MIVILQSNLSLAEQFHLSVCLSDIYGKQKSQNSFNEKTILENQPVDIRSSLPT